MKRKGGDSDLTGGSRDVNPQYFLMNQTMTAANTFTELAYATPLPRVPRSDKKITVMEILRVFFNFPDPDATFGAAGSNIRSFAQIATKQLGAYNTGNPAVFAYSERAFFGAFTAGGSFSTMSNDPMVIELTDNAGHGFLVATDNIYLGINTQGFALLQSFSVRLLYRFKNVSIEEYVGIVQGQQ